MKKAIKNNTVKAWVYLSVYSAFHRHYQTVRSNHHYQRAALTKKEKDEYLEYWKRVSPLVSTKTAEIAKSLSGVFDRHIVPEEFYALHIEPYLNDNKNLTFYENKSIYNKWFDKGIFPEVFFHKMNNNFFTHDFKVIHDIEGFIDNIIDDKDFPIVIKPNKGTFGGKDVNFVDSKIAIKDIIKNYTDLIVEKKLEQSKWLSVLNKDSINSVRVSTYRDDTGAIQILNTNIRMGKDGSLDNEGSGGIACNINSNGTFNDYAVDRLANKYVQHPNSGFVFKNQKLPFYDALIELSKRVAGEVIGARIVGLDLVLDATQTWRCIELSLFGLTIKPSQYAGVPFLGPYTDDIINKLINK